MEKYRNIVVYNTNDDTSFCVRLSEIGIRNSRIFNCDSFETLSCIEILKQTDSRKKIKVSFDIFFSEFYENVAMFSNIDELFETLSYINKLGTKDQLIIHPDGQLEFILESNNVKLELGAVRQYIDDNVYINYITYSGFDDELRCKDYYFPVASKNIFFCFLKPHQYYKGDQCFQTSVRYKESLMGVDAYPYYFRLCDVERIDLGINLTIDFKKEKTIKEQPFDYIQMKFRDEFRIELHFRDPNKGIESADMYGDIEGGVPTPIGVLNFFKYIANGDGMYGFDVGNMDFLEGSRGNPGRSWDESIVIVKWDGPYWLPSTEELS